MDKETIQRLKNDFLSWSGGTLPDSEHEIYVYADTSRRIEYDFDEVFYLLRGWMLHADEAEHTWNNR